MIDQGSVNPIVSYRDKFHKTLEEIFVNCQSLILKKNSDYTKINQSDPFHNFRQEAISMFLHNEKMSHELDDVTLGLLVRLNDKRRRRENLLLTSGSLVIDETIEDTIKDEINYLAILLSYLMIHGTHKLEKPPEPSNQMTFQQQELLDKDTHIIRLYEELEVNKKAHQLLYQEIESLKIALKAKNVSRNNKSK